MNSKRVIIIKLFILGILEAKLQAKKTLRVVGGSNVKDRHTYPYVVSMEGFILTPKFEQFYCTASMLTATWGLTAAHCLGDKFPSTPGLPPVLLVVRYGCYKPHDKKCNKSKILRQVRHPSYRQRGPPFTEAFITENDVGLIKTEPVPLPKYGKVSSVDYITLFGQSAIAVGYGLTNRTKRGKMVFGPTLHFNAPLQVLKVLMMRCETRLFSVIFNLYPGICLAPLCGRLSSICPGDSGGPLLHDSGIVGVNSVADARACMQIGDEFKTKYAGMITAISPLIEWIGNVVQE